MIMRGSIDDVARIRVRTVSENFSWAADSVVIEFDDVWLYLTGQQSEELLSQLVKVLDLHRETDPAAI